MDNIKIKPGDKVWYIDFDAGKMEPMDVESININQREIISFCVKNNDGYDTEFDGKDIGFSFFTTKEDAVVAMVDRYDLFYGCSGCKYESYNLLHKECETCSRKLQDNYTTK